MENLDNDLLYDSAEDRDNDLIFGLWGETSVFQLVEHYDDNIRADSRLALSQWEKLLQNNTMETISHWLGDNLESVL